MGFDYYVHDCTKITDKYMNHILESLVYTPAFSSMRLHIHVFDEFHRAKVPVQEKLLKPLEDHSDLLLIFCLIDLKKVSEAFRQRVTVLKTSRPEVEDLIPWLQRICDSERIAIKDKGALRQIALSADRLPRECLSLLEKIYLLGEPMNTGLVKKIAQESDDHGTQYTLDD